MARFKKFYEVSFDIEINNGMKKTKNFKCGIEILINIDLIVEVRKSHKYDTLYHDNIYVFIDRDDAMMFVWYEDDIMSLPMNKYLNAVN